MQAVFKRLDDDVDCRLVFQRESYVLVSICVVVILNGQLKKFSKRYRMGPQQDSLNATEIYFLVVFVFRESKPVCLFRVRLRE